MKNTSFTLFLLLSLFSILSCSKHSDPIPNKPYQYKGCGDFVVARLNGDSTMITVRVDQNKIAFSTAFQTFTNAENQNFAQIEMLESCNIAANWHSCCNDVFSNPGCPTYTWKLISGELAFKVSKVENDNDCATSYFATVILANPVFQKEGSNEIRQFDSVEFKNIFVGWCAG